MLALGLCVALLAGCGGGSGEAAGAAPGPGATAEPTAEPTAELPPGAVVGIVTNVVDGDTVDVAGVGRIRVIGIDTPEICVPCLVGVADRAVM